jgi:hypothetical protein
MNFSTMPGMQVIIDDRELGNVTRMQRWAGANGGDSAVSSLQRPLAMNAGREISTLVVSVCFITYPTQHWKIFAK